jgi:acyl-CoA reductase-like NAD-dependent aldehyde dehydrogenase
VHDITGHYINATWVPSIGAERTDLRDPRTDAVVGRAPSGAREDVDAAVAAAVAAFPAWATVPRKERQELMSNLERLVRDNQARLAETIEVELGSPAE